MDIHVLQHAAFEDAGIIEDWALDRGHVVKTIRLDKGEALPLVEDVSYLVVLGGPMSVHDTDAWLVDERALIARLMMKHVPVLGICLGAQQIAMSLGAEIVPTAKEVGWGNAYIDCVCDASQSGTYRVLHWHQEGFILPKGARAISYSPDWVHQGFIYGSAVALQFHLEMDEINLAALLANDSDFIRGSIFGQSKQDILDAQIPNENEVLLYSVLDWLQEQ